MIFRMTHPGNGGTATSISLRCPSCRQRGTFEPSYGNDILLDQAKSQLYSGQRRCPNTDCQALVFFVFDTQAKELLVSYPPERIDFDASSVPPRIVAALEEAITCHANGCFTAAAIMVRKTLEILCDEQGATGNNLQQRIKALQQNVVLPKDLLDGVDDLRLLGNDAAHLTAQYYDKVEQEEVEVAIELTKEVLKGLYQYAALKARLQARKKPPSP